MINATCTKSNGVWRWRARSQLNGGSVSFNHDEHHACAWEGEPQAYCRSSSGDRVVAVATSVAVPPMFHTLTVGKMASTGAAAAAGAGAGAGVGVGVRVAEAEAEADVDVVAVAVAFAVAVAATDGVNGPNGSNGGGDASRADDMDDLAPAEFEGDGEGVANGDGGRVGLPTGAFAADAAADVVVDVVVAVAVEFVAADLFVVVDVDVATALRVCVAFVGVLVGMEDAGDPGLDAGVVR